MRSGNCSDRMAQNIVRNLPIRGYQNVHKKTSMDLIYMPVNPLLLVILDFLPEVEQGWAGRSRISWCMEELVVCPGGSMIYRPVILPTSTPLSLLLLDTLEQLHVCALSWSYTFGPRCQSLPSLRLFLCAGMQASDSRWSMVGGVGDQLFTVDLRARYVTPVQSHRYVTPDAPEPHNATATKPPHGPWSSFSPKRPIFF